MTSRYIDMTPTWPEALNMLRAVLENGTDEGKTMAWEQLEHMARVAQAHVDAQKAAKAIVEGRTETAQPTAYDATAMLLELDGRERKLKFTIHAADLNAAYYAAEEHVEYTNPLATITDVTVKRQKGDNA